MGDRGRWKLIVEGDIEKLAPEPDTPLRKNAEALLEILQDGQWHSAAELREKLRKSSINSLLYDLQATGRLESIRDSKGNRVRLKTSSIVAGPESPED